jgi:hypothetical protein
MWAEHPSCIGRWSTDRILVGNIALQPGSSLIFQTNVLPPLSGKSVSQTWNQLQAAGIQSSTWMICHLWEQHYSQINYKNMYKTCKHIVACRPVARQRPRNKQLYNRPLLGNSLNWFVTCTNGVTGRRCSIRGPCDIYVKQRCKSCWERCFLSGPCRGVISWTNLEFS